MSIIFKIAIIIPLLGLITILWFFMSNKISVRAQGTTITLPQDSFYIPAGNPLKVYKFNPTPPEILEIIEKNTQKTPFTFGIFVKNLSTGQEVTLNPDEVFSAASLYKLAVMYTIYKKGETGQLDLNSADIKSNLNSMITISSNEASWYLVDKYTSWQEVTTYVQQLGLSNTTLNQNPTLTTPRDMGKLLELISEGKAVNLEASISMLELMLAQQRNDRIPVHLPPNALIAHKTGELEDVRHDAGVIITPENNFILVLMSKGSANPEAVKPIMSKISQEIYDFFSKQWANPPEIL